MQISKQDINKQTEQQITALLYQLIADLKSPQEVERLTQAIFTDSELTTFAKRLAIANYLEQGQSYDQIKDQLKVSSATIATVQNKLNQPNGYSLALQKINADQWATKWAKRIVSLFG